MFRLINAPPNKLTEGYRVLRKQRMIVCFLRAFESKA
jgi:hypothetical protein